MKKYNIKFDDKGCVEISKPISTILIYKIPYNNIKSSDFSLDISNRFVVYILFGKNEKGKDIIYVGKSKNGLDSRPTSHEDKNDNWTTCYILTDLKERTILNDGAIQYIEDKICYRVNQIDQFINTTKQTTSGTANHSDMENCKEFLEEVYDMLYVLGLDLNDYSNETYIDEENLKDSASNKKFEVPKNFKELFKKLDDLICSTSEKIVSEPMRVYQKYYIKSEDEENKKENIVCTITATQKRLRLQFTEDINKINDPNHILNVNKKGHFGVGDTFLDIVDEERFADIKDFLEQILKK